MAAPAARIAGEGCRANRNQIAAAFGNEAGQTIVALFPRGDGVVAQARVDGEPRVDPPVVLNEPTVIEALQAEKLGGVETRADGASEQEVGESETAIDTA